MKFARPEFLYAIPVLWILFAFVLAWSTARTRTRVQEFAGKGSWADSGFSTWKRRWDRVMAFFILTMLLVTLARPMVFQKDDRNELQGAPYLIALDASRSMLATDVKPSRYGAATNALDKFFAETTADRIGFITFSGVAYLNAPLTFDTVALRTILRYIDPNTLIDPGSSPVAALDRAHRFFASNSVPERVLIIISDGEELEGKSIPLAARLHKEENLVVHTIGVGTAGGARISMSRPIAGQAVQLPEVVTKLDETNLRRIAKVTGGRYFPFGPNGQGLRQLREEVLRPLAEKAARNDLRNYRELYFVPLGLAALALLAKLWLGADRFLRRRPLPSILTTYRKIN